MTPFDFAPPDGLFVTEPGLPVFGADSPGASDDTVEISGSISSHIEDIEIPQLLAICDKLEVAIPATSLYW